jgi:alcohol dehydrogenase YqhD (iron-dependent ADH family)
MENFYAYNPTKVHFGKGIVRELGKEVSALGKRALLVYGKGSVLSNGSYRETRDQLDMAEIEITEYSGIKPNPVIEDVDAAVRLGKENHVDMVIAVGGGSVIDSAKVMAVCIACDYKAWDVMTGMAEIHKALPIIAVLTLAATASEMNSIAVLQNDQIKEKFGFRHPAMFPTHSFMDPTYSCTVPADQTGYGIVDLIAHALESYFGQGDAELSDRFVESIILEAMDAGTQLMKDLGNYELRARIMWAASNALNGLTAAGRANGDFASHALGHQLSLLYDTPHAASLSISFPAWMKHMTPRIKHRIEKLGLRLFGDPSVEKTIQRFEEFFRSMDCPVRLQDVGLDHSNRDEILDLMIRNQCNGKNPENFLNDPDREAIVDLMLEY